jgi:hypothetical protein
VHSAWIALGGAFALALAACPTAGRDVATDARDVRVTETDGSAPVQARGDGYVFVARRPHGAVGLVGTHFVNDDEARRLVDRVADELESCARRLDAAGTLVEGATSLVVVTGTRGNAEISDIRFAPGGAVAANALECIVAPLRASPFPSGTDAGIPAVALEATWAPNRSGKADGGARL